jgi:hypothetical protein
MSTVSIRPLRPSDRAESEILWHGYQEFIKSLFLKWSPPKHGRDFF